MDIQPKRGIKFDATINLGHILTFLGFMATIFVGWSTLDGRVIVLEQHSKTQELRDKQQDDLLNNQNQHINETLTDIKRAVERLNDKMDKRNEKA